ncbi:MAG: tagaturonate epimerase family protein [Verrucomicrobiota bacterium]|nr:tagaturonate epimerase family protein [Verrucomicrobiota bacterium]
MLILEKYTIGVGDRFAHQAKAQLQACVELANDGIDIVPVWNKSNREHSFIGSEPQSVFDAAKAAIDDIGWDKGWHVDADHINMDTVDKYLECSDFFTIDVADYIGQTPESNVIMDFIDRHPELVGSVSIDGIDQPFEISREYVEEVAAKYLFAVQAAGKIYRHIESNKSEFIAEVSMDETDSPQTPPELLIILAALADQDVKLQTIAPKFTGRFNKGVDYVGDLAQFEKEFNDDLAVITHAIKKYGLPENLKLSVHSGSDKFSIYPIIGNALRLTGAGVHLKTAGTTWLEELIGLAEAGGEGLGLAKHIYANALKNVDALCSPYASVIDIDVNKLPSAENVNDWSGGQYANTLRHVQNHSEFNQHFRQLLHIAFKLAAKEGARYTDLLKANAEVVGKNVTENLYDRHFKRLFIA